MQLIGIDYGKARIGVAVGAFDPALAMPLSSLDGKDPVAAAQEVAKLARTEEAELVVVGLPRTLEGDDDAGESLDGARAFGALVRKASGLEVVFEDERLTTAMVERTRVNAGLGLKGFDKDAASAAAILESYIDRERNTVTTE